MYQAICFVTDTSGAATLISSDLITSASYTLTHGIGPSHCVIRMLPQASFALGECNIVFTDGTTTITLQYCKLDNMQLDFGPQGTLWELVFLDRRWKWQFGQISGRYNLYNPDQSLNTGTEKTPQQLASLCLEMMGETDYSVSNLPNDSRPLVNWDFSNPAQVLEELAESLGCRVVLHVDNSVSLEVIGSGTAPSLTDDTLAESLSIDPPEMPDEIAIVGAPIQFQMDLPLRPVGLDVDDKIVPIDDLSYIPYGDGNGWSSSDLATFSDLSITDDSQYEDCRRKAINTVYRWYQIDPTASIKIPNPNLDGEEGDDDDGDGDGGGEGDEGDEGEGSEGDGEDDAGEPAPGEPTISITSLDQILPLGNGQLVTIAQNMFGEVANVALPAWVYGKFTTEAATRLPQNNVDDVSWLDFTTDTYNNDPQLYRCGWSLDAERGIVQFPEQVYSYETGDSLLREPAKLYLRTWFNVRGDGNSQPLRYVYSQPTGSDFGTLPQFEVHEELQRHMIAQQGDDSFGVSGVTDNIAELNAEANYYFESILAGYETTAQQQLPFRNLQPIDCSGIVWQVTWSVDRDGPTSTHVSVNSDHLRTSKPYAQMRRERQLDALLKKAARAPVPQAVDSLRKG